MKEKIYDFYNKYHVLYILLIAGFYGIQLLMYELSAIISSDGHIIDMRIDELIPFCKYFVFFYFTYYFFPMIQLYLLSYSDKRKFFRLLISALIACVIGNICFLTYQVKMIRPTIEDNGFFESWVRWIYSLDKAGLNCFPSLHAVMGVFMIIGGVNNKSFPKWLEITSVIFGVGCILSTVFIKQHYFIDMVVGILLMIVCYSLVCLIDRKIKRKEL